MNKIISNLNKKVQERLKESINVESPEDYYQRTWLKANRAGIAQYINNKGKE